MTLPAVQMLSDPPRSLAQRLDVRGVALLGRDSFEVLRNGDEKLAEAKVIGVERRARS